MLRSAGFFWDFSCPFLSCDSCQRPFCHFRHASQAACVVAQDSVAVPSEFEFSTAVGLKVLEEQNDLPKLPEVAHTVLELEKVSKAIEVVKSEVQEQQQKLLKYKSLLECESCDSMTPSTSNDYNYSSPTPKVKNVLPSLQRVSVCEVPDAQFNHIIFNPTSISNSSVSKSSLSDLTEQAEEKHLFQHETMAISKTTHSECTDLHNKYMNGNHRLCNDLEYDPLMNYSTNFGSQYLGKQNMEEKERFQSSIEHNHEKRHSLASKRARSSESEFSLQESSDELVIDIPEIPPLVKEFATRKRNAKCLKSAVSLQESDDDDDIPKMPLSIQKPAAKKRFQSERTDNTILNLSLIRKVRQRKKAEATALLVDVRKSTTDTDGFSAMKDGNSKCGIYSGDLQEKQKCNSNESNPFTLTDGPVNESSRSYGLPSKSGKRKLLGLEMVKKINSGTCANATKPAKSLDQELGSEFIPDESKVVCQKREAMKEKIYEESHYRASKRLPETSYTNLEVNWQTACTVLKCSGQGAVNESKYSDDLGNNTSRINQQGQKWPNQGDIFDDEKGAEGLKKGDESLRNTIDRGEELSLSEEDVSSSLLDEDLDFSESDPMEECFRIFNESSKQETKDSGTEA
uniref:RNA exonuclease 1 homolog n=1 Tax=Callorhinchus milii TaxID=7868 RepID=A0A4W3HMP1_CALMI